MSQNSFLHLQTQRLILHLFSLDDTALVARILRDPRTVFWREKRTPVNNIRKGVKRSVDELGFTQKDTLLHVNLVHRNCRLERQDYLDKRAHSS